MCFWSALLPPFPFHLNLRGVSFCVVDVLLVCPFFPSPLRKPCQVSHEVVLKDLPWLPFKIIWCLVFVRDLSRGAITAPALTLSQRQIWNHWPWKLCIPKTFKKPFLYTLHFVSLIHSCLSTSMSNLHSIIFCQTFLFRSMLVRSPVDLQATGVVGTSARDIRADFEGPGCECWLVSDEYQRDLFSSFVRCESLSCAELSDAHRTSQIEASPEPEVEEPKCSCIC